jgi:hypothetical protein
MHNRWLVIIAAASLCLNVAVVGTYALRQARHGRDRHLPLRNLTPELRQKMKQAREAALPEFAALADRVEAVDSLLWYELRRDSFDSLRVDSLCRDLGQLHGRMRARVFRHMHEELRLLPAGTRAEYLQHMMTMRPGFGRPGHMMGRGRGMMAPPGMPPGEPPPGDPLLVEPPPPDESGR